MSNHLQNIINDHLSAESTIPSYKKKVLHDISICRTPAAGFSTYRCGDCNHVSNFYSSCGSRYCNQCGSDKCAKWLEQRLEELLPVQYFFITLTIPSRLRDLFLLNEKLCYNAFFYASSQAIKRACQYEHLFGFEVGFMSVLHSSTQELLFHPHMHILVPGGGLSEDYMEWKSCKKNYLEHAPSLALIFRQELTQALVNLYDKNKLTMTENLKHISDSLHFRNYVRGSREQKWNVHISPSKGMPEHVLDYLARYTYKTTISNERITSYDGKTVSFRVKDRDKGEVSILSLPAKTFLNRFILHILPKGFSRIRSYGFMANNQRKEKIALIKALLSCASPPVSTLRLLEMLKEELEKMERRKCPRCKSSTMKCISRNFNNRRVRVRKEPAVNNTA